MTNASTITRCFKSAPAPSPRRFTASIGCTRSVFIRTIRRPATCAKFEEIAEAYALLGDPERRAQYDVIYHRLRQDRWRLVSSGAESENDFEVEQLVRLTVLEVLYTRRRLEPGDAGIYATDLESLIGRPREHLEFTIWYLGQKKFLTRDDSSRLTITADGVEFLEQNYRANIQRKRLPAKQS
jgi:curved DNA-binding protein